MATWLDGHELVPRDNMMDGVHWCKLCGGHPDDPIHQPGFTEPDDDEEEESELAHV